MRRVLRVFCLQVNTKTSLASWQKKWELEMASLKLFLSIIKIVIPRHYILEEMTMTRATLKT